jgi:peroxiredoxin
MNATLKIGLALLAAGLYLAGCEKKAPVERPTPAKPAQEAAVQTPEKAPAFTLIDHTGKTHNLSDYLGKIVVLEWLNPGCPFVVRHYEAKTMVTLADAYAGKGVVWLGINTTSDFDQAKNKAFAEKYSLPYPVLNDNTGKVGRLYDAKTTPHVFVIDKAGVLAYQGAIDDDPTGTKADKINYVKAAVDELLAGKPVTTKETKPYGCSVKYAE